MQDSNDVLIGNQAASPTAVKPVEAKKHHHSPPCAADVFHKLSSQLGHSCPNHRPWEKMRKRRRERAGKEEESSGGQKGGWLAWQRSDRLRQPECGNCPGRHVRNALG